MTTHILMLTISHAQPMHVDSMHGQAASVMDVVSLDEGFKGYCTQDGPGGTGKRRADLSVHLLFAGTHNLEVRMCACLVFRGVNVLRCSHLLLWMTR